MNTLPLPSTTYLNFFFFHIHDFVFLAPTGKIERGLFVANYSQADTRYQGVEGKLNLNLRSDLWQNPGLDAVHARLTKPVVFLPRIPPLRGRASLDYRWRSFSVTPELSIANRQGQILTIETPTAGYVVFNLRGSYTVTRQHALQMFSVNFFNAGNALYRNHLSYIKQFAPEIGRGVQFTCTLRFFRAQPRLREIFAGGLWASDDRVDCFRVAAAKTGYDGVERSVCRLIGHNARPWKAFPGR